MKLNDLLNNIPIQAASCDLTAEVAGITLDSRRCKPGYVFCAVVGAETARPACGCKNSRESRDCLLSPEVALLKLLTQT